MRERVGEEKGGGRGGKGERASAQQYEWGARVCGWEREGEVGSRRERKERKKRETFSTPFFSSCRRLFCAKQSSTGVSRTVEDVGARGEERGAKGDAHGARNTHFSIGRLSRLTLCAGDVSKMANLSHRTTNALATLLLYTEREMHPLLSPFAHI